MVNRFKIGTRIGAGFALGLTLLAVLGAVAYPMTAHARVSDQAHALATGFQHHLPKPVEADVLIQTILQVTGTVS